MNEKNAKWLERGIFLFIIVVVLLSLLRYTNLENERIIQDYDFKINTSNDKIYELDQALENQNILFTNLINSVKEENKKNVDNLNKLISDLEDQSNLQLGELKEELSNVKVQSADFSGVIEDVIGSVVSVITEKGQGSGVFIDDNYIVTNFHVIDGAKGVRVYTYDEKLFNAFIVGAETTSDIAVLKIDKPYPYLEFGDSDRANVGQKVIALGNPGGLDFTVTEGIISSTNRVAPNGISYLQIDVAINPGNSGGPLIDLKGKIIGINNWKMGGVFEGLGFAIPSNKVEAVSDEIIKRYEEGLEG